MDVAERLIRAFPPRVTREAELVARAMVAKGTTLSPDSFQVVVDGDLVAIPERLYLDAPVLVEPGGPLAACLITRHHNGFLRQQALERVLLSSEPWAIPFIVRLVGEYVIEIIQQIDDAFASLSIEALRRFVVANPDFIRLTRARVTSYWNCYYRRTPSDEHVAFRLIDRIEAAATEKRAAFAPPAGPR